MDEYSGKRGIDGVVVPRKGTGLVFRDTANTRNRNGQLCSRLGCSGRVNNPKFVQIDSSEKGKSLRPSIQFSSCGKEAIGSSSRSTKIPGKPLIEPRKTLSSQLETDSSETSSVKDEPEISVLIPPPETILRGLQAEVENTESSSVTQMEVGSSSVISNTRSRRNLHREPGLSEQEINSTSPVTPAVASRSGLRNLRCDSISEVIPASCSSSDSTLNRRKDMIKKRNCKGESRSTARGKKMSGSPLEGQNSGPRNGISISDSRISRNIPSHRDSSIALFRTRRSSSVHARGRLSSQGNENPIAPNESPVMIPPSLHSGDLNIPSVLHHASAAEASLSRPSSYGRPGTSIEQLCGVMPVSPAEYGITRSPICRDSFRRYNMDGIAEVLLALERTEQDEELTHEQILLLETNLFLNGLNFYDHHRDMRLDIDNMSYEELLALEERMGTVSTALTEEALSECLKRSIYLSAPSTSNDAAESCNKDKDDTKCSICQEEYVAGDEVGSLQCEHKFHAVCVQQWLRLKNWCPICKVSAASSNSSSPH